MSRVAFVKAFRSVHHVHRSRTVEREGPPVALGVRARHAAVGMVESDESNWRVSRLSAVGRRDRLEGVGFRVDMDQTPLFQEARPTDRPGAHLERRSRLDLSQIPFSPEAPDRASITRSDGCV